MQFVFKEKHASMPPPRSVSVKAAVLLTFCSRRLGGLLRFSCCWGVGRVDSAAVDSAYPLTLARRHCGKRTDSGRGLAGNRLLLTSALSVPPLTTPFPSRWMTRFSPHPYMPSNQSLYLLRRRGGKRKNAGERVCEWEEEES